MRTLPEEWFPQSGIQLTWPHTGTDWRHMLKEVQTCFAEIATQIVKYEKLLIVAPNINEVKKQLKNKLNSEKIIFVECETNDTWARDHGAITVLEKDKPLVLDFRFNGWGQKFASDLDNQITRKIYQQQVLHGMYENHLGFTLEGGSIESDGKGTLMTTSTCLLAPNRNEEMDQGDIEQYLIKTFGARRVLWVNYGFLSGDDTDGHIDTLARFCPNDTILYIKCNNLEDDHYEPLKKMEEQLESFKTLEGKPYRLIPVPMADEIKEDSLRLPATYANFLAINGAVLFPTYNQPANDKQAENAIRNAFPNYDVIGIDCRALIKQHGSLHCVTMQYPIGVI